MKKPFDASALVGAVARALAVEGDRLAGEARQDSAEAIPRRSSAIKLPGLFEVLLLVGIVLFVIAVIILAGR